ncbi:hypothetical protein TREMEDRAFT_63880 [Tremella mesenterica DSM 1558]|uniref:uncharacterized protein n=1 Tax=Tremella mesenterica (strain ATCC 24925 / CBS 8224 / DSM 1558 / NBRC 9311 / NRRL Y-6157 / RJB 2259-6 / UBC 559-6) TaxID=578456 RepID=UPI0003F4981C|nr:uncharacterized protein TREMEDRAFT_63880 [Tremella mesenterica DSM 1558]EIW67996.1 hypothetical protein TREMEDRAFT_63880 [Tremella mesenterica DSM 1558]
MRISLLSLFILPLALSAPSPQPANSPGKTLHQATRKSVIDAMRREALGLRRRQTTNAPYPVCPGEQGPDATYTFAWAVYPNTLGTYEPFTDQISSTETTSLDNCISACEGYSNCIDISWRPAANPNCYLLSAIQTNLQEFDGLTAVFRDTDCAGMAASANGRACCNIYTTTE